jgi:hypothetical protein
LVVPPHPVPKYLQISQWLKKFKGGGSFVSESPYVEQYLRLPKGSALKGHYAIKVLEMEKHGDNGMCCGAGGGRMFVEETIGKRINNERVLEAMDTGADFVTAVCPFGITMLSDGIKDSGRKRAVRCPSALVCAISTGCIKNRFVVYTPFPGT